MEDKIVCTVTHSIFAKQTLSIESSNVSTHGRIPDTVTPSLDLKALTWRLNASMGLTLKTVTMEVQEEALSYPIKISELLFSKPLDALDITALNVMQLTKNSTSITLTLSIAH